MLLPIPKVASTLLKRLAVLADGREPYAGAALGETKPALAIHQPQFHGLLTLAQLAETEQQRWCNDPHILRLVVTRHPGERLLSFWHDKLHLADPAYAPLNSSVQAARGKESSEPCRFSDFLSYLSDHWELLQGDGHLMPQHRFIGQSNLFNLRLDRNQLVKELPRSLKTLLPAERLQRLNQELKSYDNTRRQRLSHRWEEAYGKEGFALLETIYGEDLERFEYSLPSRRREKVKPLAS